MKNFTYEHYMNLLFHMEYCDEKVIPEISRRVLSHAISPVITVMSTPLLDSHISDVYNVDSLYMCLRFFSGCVSDRDQANEYKSPETDEIDETTEKSNNLEVPANVVKRRRRSRSNSLFQRDSTQLQYIRFARPLSDLVNSRDANDMLFDYHSLEVYLVNYLKLLETRTNDKTPDQLLKKSLFHSFFSLAISSTTTLSPYESFNHPILSLIAIDITKGQGYEDGRELLLSFKNLHRNTSNFPAYINTNDILPVFLLCFDSSSSEEVATCDDLCKKFKKQLFVEAIALPLWNSEYKNDTLVKLHQPVMSSLEEMIYFIEKAEITSLPLSLLNSIYDVLDELVYDLLIPFMQRKISFWDETIMQPRKSLFHGSKWVKKLMSKTGGSAHQQQESLSKDAQGNAYFTSASTEFLLRKLGDWSMMLSNFKSAYLAYESLSHDLENYPKYLATCLEWEATSLLLGAQNIVTVKMIKTEIVPLIERALDIYDLSTLRNTERKQQSTDGAQTSQPFRSYETRCMVLSAELFLSLSDTWISTPYAIEYLELMLSECKLGPCSQIMIWERLSDCYSLRLDPRIRHKVENGDAKLSKLKQLKLEELDDKCEQTSDLITKEEEEVITSDYDIVAQGLTRKRKAAFFRLLAATKWAEQKQWRQVAWCLNDVHDAYSGLELSKRDDLILRKLQKQLELSAVDFTSPDEDV